MSLVDLFYRYNYLFVLLNLSYDCKIEQKIKIGKINVFEKLKQLSQNLFFHFCRKLKQKKVCTLMANASSCDVINVNITLSKLEHSVLSCALMCSEA